MYTSQITAIPLSDDPTQSVVTATLSDDSGQPDIIRNYSLPVASNPAPADFQTLIQADVDALNTAQTAQTSLAQSFTSQTTVPTDNDAVTASVTPDSASTDSPVVSTPIVGTVTSTKSTASTSS